MWHCVKCEQGFVLLMVLLFLQVFSAFGLYALENSLLEMKMNKLVVQQKQHFFAAESFLRAIEEKLDGCIIPVTPVHELTVQPLSWWQAQGCAGDSDLFQYYYVIEELGQDVGACVNNMAANYWRITLLSTFKTDPDRRVILQSTVIKPDNRQHCSQESRVVLSGRQMWRNIQLD